MKISSGKMSEIGTRCVIYGTSGIGKTTLASRLPKPLFLDLELSSKELDVDRTCPESFAELKNDIAELTKDSLGYKTVVIDVGDAMEALFIQDYLYRKGADSIDKAGAYGVGYKDIRQDLGRFFDNNLRKLADSGVNVVVVYHCMTKTVYNPDGTNYDTYDVVHQVKGVSDIPKGWADLVLFLKNDIDYINKGTKDNPKLIPTDQQRVIYTQGLPTFEAKSRFNIPRKLPLINELNDELKQCFAGSRTDVQTPKKQNQEKPKFESIKEKVQPKNNTQESDFSEDLKLEEEWADLVAIAPHYQELSKIAISEKITVDDISWVTIYGGKQAYFPEGTKPQYFTKEYVQGMLLAKWDVIKKIILKHKGA